jgi:ethanolamine utilization protein EutL
MAAAVGVAEGLDFAEVAGVPYLAYTVSSCGSFLAKEAGVPVGSALAYLIAPPMESMVALNGALKAADVELCKLYSPPTPTNFGGGLLTGSRSACEAACGEFARIVGEIAKKPRR